MNNIFGQPIGNLESDRITEQHPSSLPCTCSHRKGELIRLYIAPGTSLDVLGSLEVTSPSGACFIVRLPSSEDSGELDLIGILDNLRKSGLKIEIINE